MELHKFSDCPLTARNTAPGSQGEAKVSADSARTGILLSSDAIARIREIARNKNLKNCIAFRSFDGSRSFRLALKLKKAAIFSKTELLRERRPLLARQIRADQRPACCSAGALASRDRSIASAPRPARRRQEMIARCACTHCASVAHCYT
ncbi:hypothetical protein X777_03860 [Ooceraea biroi]|uniref:Uncharacterized protein n=1 Tax=Ooceraea biroi TaxID=2015173 RepID=A0A026WHY0_OOCBI|nr:hypothetical protein X777_03860 [Ooceraea biroi]